MATPFTIETMSMAHPQCAGIHREIKELIPENDLLALMGEGFTDCSYGNDECPSYYVRTDKKLADVLTIMVLDDVDSVGARISGNVRYMVLSQEQGVIEIYDSVHAAIKKYKNLHSETIRFARTIQGLKMNNALRIKTLKESKRAQRNQMIADVFCWLAIGSGGAFCAWSWYIIAIVIMGLDV